MKNDYIVRKLYISFVVVSILSALTATAGMLIDNIIVGAYLGEDALGAMGIVGPVSLIFSAFGNICSGGGTAQAAQAMGKGDIKKMNQLFTVTMVFVGISGVVLTAVGVLFAPNIAQILGAKDALVEPSVQYLRGFFLGAVPTIMMSALMGFVKIDGSPKLPLICIAVMTAANVVLDLLMAHVLRWGMFGMALATSISYCLAVLTGLTHFRKKTAILKLTRPDATFKDMAEIIRTGAPTALSRICDTIKAMALNHLLILNVGVGAVTAMNVRTQANSFFGAFILGLAQASVPLVGMFYGEEDRRALKDTLKTTLRIGLMLNIGIALILMLIAPGFTSVLGVADPSIENMAVTAVRFFAAGMPLALTNMIMMSFYQSTKKTGMATMICICQSLIFVVALAFILIKPFGATGAWLALLGADILTLIMLMVLVFVKKQSHVSFLDCMMGLDSSFGADDRNSFELSIGNSMEELMLISQGIHRFGEGRSIDRQLLNKVSLCIEEMGGNVIRHAFRPGEKKWFDLKVIDKEDVLILRLRDNGAAFDPIRFLEETDMEKEMYGIRMIQGIADHMEYRRSLGLNTLFIVMNK